MKTLKFTLYGKQKEVYFVLDTYAISGDLAILAYNIDENGYDDYYGDVSKALQFGRINGDDEFYADTNNSSSLIEEMLKQGLIKDTDESCSSGFCVYPKMKLTKKFKEYVKENEDQ